MYGVGLTLGRGRWWSCGGGLGAGGRGQSCGPGLDPAAAGATIVIEERDKAFEQANHKAYSCTPASRRGWVTQITKMAGWVYDGDG